MQYFWCQTGAVALGFLLDLIFGDPHWLYHPVQLIGSLISKLEKVLLKDTDSDKKKFRNGALLAVLVTALTGAVTILILFICYRISMMAGFIVESVMCYQILAVKSLRVESMKVYTALKQDGLPAARTAVSMIVGRDTAQLDEHGIVRAAVETVAENTSDGVIAPLFYMFFFGAAGGFIYKAVNTMDSMIGYKNDKYLYFGRFAAKLDDVLIGGNCLTGRKKRRKALQPEKCVENFSARPKKAQQSEFRPDGSRVRRCINGRFIRR